MRSVKRAAAMVHDTVLHRRFSRVWRSLRKRVDGVSEDVEEVLIASVSAKCQVQVIRRPFLLLLNEYV